MNLKEYKFWLEGFMQGSGTQNIEDLSKQEALVALKKLNEVIPEYSPYWVYPNVMYKSVSGTASDVHGITSTLTSIAQS